MLRILHITNEITKKNFSISSLIDFISINARKEKLFESSTLCSFKDENIYRENRENLDVLNIKWKHFLKLRKFFLNKIISYDLIHIHGVWAPIQLYSIILCLFYNKKAIIHPHGMLLPNAINDNGITKKINKKFFLIFLKFLFMGKKNILFVAITRQELYEISKLFPGLRVKLIQNNIPFQNHGYKYNVKFKKVFVFFGRIHPHKNILEMIKLFIESDLINQDWKLEIYGIPDDKKYFDLIKKFISNYPQIKVLNPVFGLEKVEIISRSWINILISKSEVLSFSIMESGVYGLPSIITKNIETLQKDVYSQKVENENKTITDKFKEIAEWTENKRRLIGDQTKLFFNNYKKHSDILILQKLHDTYKEIFNKQQKIQGYSFENFYIASLVQSLNVFMPNIILILCFIFYSNKLTAEIGLTNIIFITATQMLSGNVRLIAIKKQSVHLLQENLLFRFSIGLLFIFIYQILMIKFNFIEDKYTNVIISFYIVLLWCSELILSVYEIKRTIGKLVKILIFYFLILSLLIITFLYGQVEHFRIVLFTVCIGLLFLYFTEVKLTNIRNIKTSFFSIIFGDILKYISSLSLTISSLCWRFYLFFTYPKEITGIIFIAFAICSFPGTFFNNVLGPNFFYNKIKINKKVQYLFILSFLLLVIYNFIYFELINIENTNKELFYHFLKISALGSFIMFYGMYIRHQLVFEKKLKLNSLFYKDIFYGFILTIILPVLDILGGINYLSFSYLLGSILAVIVFKINTDIKITNKYNS